MVKYELKPARNTRERMPNQTGGKNYKKKKKDGGESEKIVFLDREPGQEPARVIKLLGNCNVQLYCNDGGTRVGHIRGSMQKKVWINVGDIVLISFREDTSAKPGEEKADILAKYDPRSLNKLKKEAGVNPRLFTMIENNDTKSATLPHEDEDLFEREGEESEKEEEDFVPRGVEATWGGRRGGKRVEGGAAGAEVVVPDDVDIDAI